MRHAEAHVRAFAILESKHLLADPIPATRLLPKLRRVKCRQEKLLTADGVHLFTQDLHHFERDSLAQRQQRINTRGQLPDHAGAEEYLVRNDLGISRVFTESWD